MKELKYILVIVLFSLLHACDVVEEPVVYEESEVIEYGFCDTTEMDTSLNVVVVSKGYAGRKILLEDYTGHQCGNCPEAGIKSEEMVAKYGEQIVPIGVHAGFFAETNESGKYTTDFTTEASETYFTEFNVITNPNGIVNRSKYNGALVLGVDQWDAAIQSLKDLPRFAKIDMSSTYNTERHVDLLDVTITFDSASSANYNLIVMITEDNLVDWQKDYSKPSGEQDVENYVHRHVLRGVANNLTWGESVNTAAVNAGDSFDFNFQICINESWKDTDIHLVAVLHDNATKRVVQCEEIKIIK